jgi:hypothetical protein
MGVVNQHHQQLIYYHNLPKIISVTFVGLMPVNGFCNQFITTSMTNCHFISHHSFNALRACWQTAIIRQRVIILQIKSLLIYLTGLKVLSLTMMQIAYLDKSSMLTLH